MIRHIGKLNRVELLALHHINYFIIAWELEWYLHLCFCPYLDPVDRHSNNLTRKQFPGYIAP